MRVLLRSRHPPRVAPILSDRRTGERTWHPADCHDRSVLRLGAALHAACDRGADANGHVLELARRARLRGKPDSAQLHQANRYKGRGAARKAHAAAPDVHRLCRPPAASPEDDSLTWDMMTV